MKTDFVPQWLIERKRDGGELSDAEIREWIARYSDGRLPDYQMAAMAMAIVLRGMNRRETLALTDAMMRSGDVLSWDDLDRPTADKHSTGGIGDKISIPLAPIAAACGLAVPMISGRGLGITGGTLDKLDSIPGYSTRLPVSRFRAVVKKVGCSIVGQTDRLAPADRRLYSLRDVTGTTPSLALITGSILSKKLAEGASTLVFDVKCGKSCFMPTPEAALELAHSLVSVSRGAGRAAQALITDMSQPVGRAAGNALEIRESVEILQGRGPEDAVELVMALGSRMLVLSGLAKNAAAARAEMAAKIASGEALEVFARMVKAHGGDPRVAERPEKILPAAKAAVDVPAPRSGYVTAADTSVIGRCILQLGGGRRSVADAIDYGVGVDNLVKVGERVEKGDPLLRLHAGSKADAAEFSGRIAGAFAISPEKPPVGSPVIRAVTR